MTHAGHISFSADNVHDLMRYGFDKIKATVSFKGTITFRNRTYIVVDGVEKFARQKSTKVHVSSVNGKLYIFEYKEDGILLGEAICQEPFERAEKHPGVTLKTSEVERMIHYLSEKAMAVDRGILIEQHRKGLTLTMAQSVYERNKARYDAYLRKLRQSPQITGTALFNAFILDCTRHQQKTGYGVK